MKDYIRESSYTGNCVPNANFTGDNVQHLFGYKQQEQICAEYKDSGTYLCVASRALL